MPCRAMADGHMPPCMPPCARRSDDRRINETTQFVPAPPEPAQVIYSRPRRRRVTLNSRRARGPGRPIRADLTPTRLESLERAVRASCYLGRKGRLLRRYIPCANERWACPRLHRLPANGRHHDTKRQCPSQPPTTTSTVQPSPDRLRSIGPTATGRTCL